MDIYVYACVYIFLYTCVHICIYIQAERVLGTLQIVQTFGIMSYLITYYTKVLKYYLTLRPPPSQALRNKIQILIYY